MKKVSLLMVIKKRSASAVEEMMLSNRYWAEFAEIHRNQGRLREKHTGKSIFIALIRAEKQCLRN